MEEWGSGDVGGGRREALVGDVEESKGSHSSSSSYAEWSEDL